MTLTVKLTKRELAALKWLMERPKNYSFKELYNRVAIGQKVVKRLLKGVEPSSSRRPSSKARD